ncbi:MAG: hypothetical protein DMF87_19305 [Acidobacteria bacterium]|nr:MAG: hypothetical protein DMF87_19305 [Acidobacteriota bacterium]
MSLRRVGVFIATCAHVGYAPVAPGTFGSAVGLVIYYLGIDPGPVVIDEVIGMLITLALHPVNVAGAVAGFLIFRVLDVVKPWPARRLELLPGGFGVVLDDAMAGIYGNLMVWGLIRLLPAWFT